MAGEDASGLVCTAVVIARGAPVRPVEHARSSARDRIDLVFIDGRGGAGGRRCGIGFEGGARGAWIVKKGVNILGRKDFSRPQWDSL